jgi:hypothetical protein
MDPMALFAVAGLIFAGKKLSEREGYTGVPADREIQGESDIERRSRQMYHLQSNDMGIGGGSAVKIAGPKEVFMGSGVSYMRKDVVENLGDITPDGKRFPYGQPVYDLYNRQGITNKMNNLNPADKKYVGRGLGVGPDVPAQGGFQQFFRVLPTNTNENRLTQLPGRVGPPVAAVASAPTVIGSLTQVQRPSKVYSREMGGAKNIVPAHEPRPTESRTERSTLKDQTVVRSDTLSFGAGQYQNVKMDARDMTGNQIRGTDNRSNEIDGFMPGGGRMNVRQGPLGMNGALTQIREDTTALPIPPAGPTAGRFQQYKDAEVYKFNEYKSNQNPYSANLSLAQRQLKDNPLAFSISSA